MFLYIVKNNPCKTYISKEISPSSFVNALFMFTLDKVITAKIGNKTEDIILTTILISKGKIPLFPKNNVITKRTKVSINAIIVKRLFDKKVLILPENFEKSIPSKKHKTASYQVVEKRKQTQDKIYTPIAIPNHMI